MSFNEQKNRKWKFKRIVEILMKYWCWKSDLCINLMNQFFSRKIDANRFTILIQQNWYIFILNNGNFKAIFHGKWWLEFQCQFYTFSFYDSFLTQWNGTFSSFLRMPIELLPIEFCYKYANKYENFNSNSKFIIHSEFTYQKRNQSTKKLQHYQYSGNELSKQQQRKTHENGRDNFNNIISRASIFCLHYFATVQTAPNCIKFGEKKLVH